MAIERIIKQYISNHPENTEEIKKLKSIRMRKSHIFDKKMYDDLIGWKIKTQPTIKDTMDSQLQKQIEQIIENNESSNNQKDICVIKECMGCGEGNKKAIMRLILATQKMGIDISLYYPDEYKKYLEIRNNIIKEKIKQKSKQATGEDKEK